MDALGAVVAFAAVTAPVALVLRDIAAYDRPSVVEDPPVADKAPELVVAPVLGVGRLPLAEPVPVAVTVPPLEPEPVREPVRPPVREPIVVRSADVQRHDSVLAALGPTETDEHSVLRRVGALVVLLTLTLLTAALVGAGIYRLVSALG